MKTIGIAATAGSGKDTLAQYLIPLLTTQDDVWIRAAFADKIKDIFCELFNVDKQFIENWKRIKTPPPGFLKNVRECLTDIGDKFRYMKSDIWIDHVFLNQKHNQVITDMRYPNEVTRVHAVDGVSILLSRSTTTEYMAEEQHFAKYVSQLRELNIEGPIPAHLNIKFDLFITNDGTLEQLEDKIKTTVMSYLKGRGLA